MERMQWLQALARGNDAKLAGRLVDIITNSHHKVPRSFLRNTWMDKLRTNEVDDFLEVMKAFAQYDAQSR